jgi:YD repeat-containing protein
MKPITITCLLVGALGGNCASNDAADKSSAEDAAQAHTQTQSQTNDLPPGPCRKTVENADGEPTAVHRLSYDAQGRLVERRVVQPSDGTLEKVERHVYEDGRLVREIVENPQSGRERPRTLVHFYGEDGERIRTEEDFRKDPAPDTITRYSYDEQGQLVREAEDFNLDGKPDVVFVQEFDDQGRLVRRAKFPGPPDTTERPEWSQTYEDDEQGRRTARLEDSDADGQVDVRVEFTYDDHDNVIERTTDFTVELGVDERIIFERTYDDSGRQVRVEKHFASPNGLRRLMKTTKFDYQCN